MLRVYLLASSRSISLHFTRERKSKPSVITVPFSCRAIATSALSQIFAVYQIRNFVPREILIKIGETK